MAVSSIYLDNHATTRVDPRVLDTMLPWFSEKYGNASSIQHAYGVEAAEGVEAAREQTAELLDASPRSLIFTSGATESNNMALFGVMRAASKAGHFITAAAEHRSVLDPARRLKRQGNDVTILPVDVQGRVQPDDVAAAIRPETVLVSVMWANNEVGTINRVAEIGAICRQRGVLFHTDAVQAVGKIPVDVGELPIDLLSLSAHKLYGPKGVGALYVRRGEPRIAIEPIMEGGGHERHLRSGTLPVPLIVGFGAACRIARDEMTSEAPRIRALRDRLWDRLSSRLEGVLQNGAVEDRLPGNLSVSMEGVDGEALMTGLHGLAVSSGSACTSAEPEPSHVLRAMGLSDSLTRASLRFGVGRFNTETEIDRAVEIVAACVNRLRQGG